MAGKKKKAVEATPTDTAPASQPTANAEIQDVAQQIGKILRDHGLGMQATIEIFKLEVLNPDLTGMVQGKLKEESNEHGTVTNVTPSEEVMREILERPGDEISPKQE